MNLYPPIIFNTLYRDSIFNCSSSILTNWSEHYNSLSPSRRIEFAMGAAIRNVAQTMALIGTVNYLFPSFAITSQPKNSFKFSFSTDILLPALGHVVLKVCYSLAYAHFVDKWDLKKSLQTKEFHESGNSRFRILTVEVLCTATSLFLTRQNTAAICVHTVAACLFPRARFLYITGSAVNLSIMEISCRLLHEAFSKKICQT